MVKKAVEKVNIFLEVKQQVRPKQAAQFYMGHPAKSGQTDFYYSPFRKERTPSFAVHDEKGITDFGSGEHFDIVSFVQKLHGITPIEAAKKIASDFHLNININPFDETDNISSYQPRNGLRKWREKAFDRLCEIYRGTQKTKKTLPPDSVGFFVACELEGPLDYLTDMLISDDEKDWLEVYRQIGEAWGL
jgi:DNA primase